MLTTILRTARRPCRPLCLRNHLMLKEMKEGRGPIYMDTVTALAKLKEVLSPKEVKHLEAEAWEDFLDMCVGQSCGIWVGENIEPEKKNSELNADRAVPARFRTPAAAGIWVSGPRPTSAHRAPAIRKRPVVPGHLPKGWNWGSAR